MARRRRNNNEEISIPGGIAILSFLAYFQREKIWAWIISNPHYLSWIIIGISLLISLAIFGLWRLRIRSTAKAYRRLLNDQARQLQPSQFEQYIETLLLSLGWKDVNWVGGSGDGGVDLYASKNELRYIVQCKRYKDLVPPHYIRELYGTLQDKGADRALLVTTGRVSDQTREWIKDKPIEIWDGTQLGALLAPLRRSTTEPNYLRKQRRAGRWVLIGLAVFNMVVFVGALIAPSYLPAASSLAQAVTASPTTKLAASPSPEPAPTATALPIEAKAYALVSHGGNLRATASMDGEVLILVKIADRLELLGKSSDGEWLHVKTEQEVIGWVHKTLLSIDPEVETLLTSIP